MLLLIKCNYNEKCLQSAASIPLSSLGSILPWPANQINAPPPKKCQAPIYLHIWNSMSIFYIWTVVSLEIL